MVWIHLMYMYTTSSTCLYDCFIFYCCRHLALKLTLRRGLPPWENRVPFLSFVPGGTSLACPAFAAMMALKQEQRKKVYGFANPFFYSHPNLFRDVKNGRKFVIKSDGNQRIIANSDTSLTVARGYDNVTGLGTPGPKFWRRFWKVNRNGKCLKRERRKLQAEH